MSVLLKVAGLSSVLFALTTISVNADELTDLRDQLVSLNERVEVEMNRPSSDGQDVLSDNRSSATESDTPKQAQCNVVKLLSSGC